MAPAAPELAEALKDPDPKIRYPSVIALAYANPTDQRAVPILIDILNDKDGVTPFRWTVLGCGTKSPADDSFRS
jgi:HEAT repeat protein